MSEPLAFIIHDDPELGDYLTKSREAADQSGKRVTPLYAALSESQMVEAAVDAMRDLEIKFSPPDGLSIRQATVAEAQRLIRRAAIQLSST